MVDNTLNLIFASLSQNTGQIFNLDLDKLKTEIINKDYKIITGSYNYKSEQRHGSSLQSEGKLYLDRESNLLSIVTYNDHPKGETILRKINDCIESQVFVPKYKQESSVQFYRTFGFNGYTTSFKKDLTDYSLGSNPRHVKPDEIMKQRSMKSERRPSDDWLEEITLELINKEYYISTMDFVPEKDGRCYSFSEPMRVTGINENDWDNDLRDLIFKRMNELINDNVPTVQEVLEN